MKQQPLVVAPGVTEAAVAHIRVLIESIRLFTRQLKEAHRQLDRLCSLLAKPIPGDNEQTEPEPEQTLVAILQSLPGAGRIVLSVLLAEAFETLQRPDYAILRILCGVAPVTRRSGKTGPSPEGSPAIQDCGTPFTTWQTPRGAATRKAKPNISP
ncbi:MAG: transposase [Rhodomicrobium sp.]